MPAGVYEMIDITDTITDLVEVNVFTDDVAMTTRITTNNF